MMEPIGSYKGRDNVYRRHGYDTKGRKATFHYHRNPDGTWESLEDKGWEALNVHVNYTLNQRIFKKHVNN